MHASLDPSLASKNEAEGRLVYRRLLERLRALPVVESAAMASAVPFGDMHEDALLERVGAPSGTADVRAHTYRIITADYFAAVGLKMVRGREFTMTEEESAEAPPVAIADELLARTLFGNEDPVGQLIKLKPRSGDDASSKRYEPMQIVGIAPPIRNQLLDGGPVAHMYVPFGGRYRANMHLHARRTPGTGDAAALAALRQEIRAADAQLPVLALSTMQALHDRSLELWVLKAGGRMFAALGVLALLLAVVGVYGVKSYVVSQRTREFGIRMALGATAQDVLRLVLRDGAWLTGAGLAVGVPLAALVSVAFAKVFVEIGGFDPLVVGGATAVLATAALMASYLPARRATRVTPVRALRAD
jgi:hypothetical protein